jgi:hypothetical protein
MSYMTYKPILNACAEVHQFCNGVGSTDEEYIEDFCHAIKERLRFWDNTMFMESNLEEELDTAVKRVCEITCAMWEEYKKQ